MTVLTGMIHVHSNYSYDGRDSLQEIANLARRMKFSFVCMSEHSDTMNEEVMSVYVGECRGISRPECILIPGIEFTCTNRLHLLGIGMERYTNETDPVRVANFIRKQNKIAVIAHPVRYKYHIPLGLAEAVDGIEVWNTGYDGRFIPNTSSLQLLREARKNNLSLMAFGGEDLHEVSRGCSVMASLSCDAPGEEGILAALKSGHFTIYNKYFRLDSSQEPGWCAIAALRLATTLYHAAKRIRASAALKGWR